MPMLMPAEVVYQKNYSGKLTVVRLEVPAGFAQQCHRLGSYIMAQVMGYMVPLSVLHSSYAVEKKALSHRTEAVYRSCGSANRS